MLVQDTHASMLIFLPHRLLKDNKNVSCMFKIKLKTTNFFAYSAKI